MKKFVVGFLLGIFASLAIMAYIRSPESFSKWMPNERGEENEAAAKLDALKQNGKETAAKVAENMKEKGQEALDSGKDLAISVAIRSKFKLDSEIDSKSIRIDVKDGLVRLTGSVPDYSMARYAIEKAAEVEGVKGVESELDIASN